MTVVTTTCPMDCPDTCALDVHVDDGRVTAIRGSRGDHPTTDGFICSKVGSFAKRVYHESRILHPLRRKGAKGSGEFERITWKFPEGRIFVFRRTAGRARSGFESAESRVPTVVRRGRHPTAGGTPALPGAPGVMRAADLAGLHRREHAAGGVFHGASGMAGRGVEVCPDASSLGLTALDKQYETLILATSARPTGRANQR